MKSEIRAVGLDLGNTLMTYDGVPLSWEAGYPAAMAAVAARLGATLSGEAMERACNALRAYNTRVHPREAEVTAQHIFAGALAAAGLGREGAVDAAVDAFFGCFRQSYAVYEDALPFLRGARSADLPAGILTDVPYGMPEGLVRRDVQPFEALVSCVLSSVQVGWRKPRPEGFLALAATLGVPPQAMVFIGDEAKDVHGAQAAGMFAILLDRSGNAPACGEDARVASLQEAGELLGLLDTV